jgi:alpha-1,3-glucosyltransferase
MRYTVIVSDIAFLLPALLVFHRTFTNKLAGKLSAGGTGAKSGERTDLAISKKFSAKTQKLSIAYAFTAAALSPAQMLIDHGHFQYNGISLGLSVYAAAAVISDWDVIGSILFTLALNHKQTAAYLSPAFFAFLLGKSLRNNSTSYTKVAAVLRLGIAVVGTFAVLWAPFYFAIDPETGTADGVRGVKTVFQRLVPFKRGLYEDYVSNVWCFTNPFFKWKTWLSIETATRLALLCTVTAIAPAVAHQIKKPSNEGFVWCLVNCGFGFFLWSFQVHEKVRISHLPNPASLFAHTRRAKGRLTSALTVQTDYGDCCPYIVPYIAIHNTDTFLTKRKVRVVFHNPCRVARFRGA